MFQFVSSKKKKNMTVQKTLSKCLPRDFNLYSSVMAKREKQRKQENHKKKKLQLDQQEEELKAEIKERLR